MMPYLKVLVVGLGTCFIIAMICFLIINAFQQKDDKNDKVSLFIRNAFLIGLILGGFFVIGSCMSKSTAHYSPTPFDDVSDFEPPPRR